MKFGHAMIEDWVSLGQFVSLPLPGNDMQELWSFELLEILQGRYQGIQIVTVNRADIIEAELLE